MPKTISVKSADVIDFACDVLVLKFAQGFYGADALVAGEITSTPEDIEPEPGDFILLPSNGKVAARNVLFVGVRPLYEFDYKEIREFSERALKILRDQVPNATHIAMTMHGVGYGLDEKESFLAQIAGILDAFRTNDNPDKLKQVTIVERNRDRAARLTGLLEENLPPEFSTARPKPAKPVAQVPRISAGRRSKEKPHVFVAMPFSKEMEDVYIFGIQGPVNAAGFLCERVDMSIFAGDILARIKSRIETAALVIADLSGANPNVYLEVGYAWGKDRSTLLLSKQSDELKFDVRGQRTLIYESIADLAKKLAADLKVLK